jgi:hypothetical protein
MTQNGLIETLMSDLEHFKVAAQTLVSIANAKDLEIAELEKQLNFHRDDIVNLNRQLQYYRELHGNINV